MVSAMLLRSIFGTPDPTRCEGYIGSFKPLRMWVVRGRLRRDADILPPLGRVKFRNPNHSERNGGIWTLDEQRFEESIVLLPVIARPLVGTFQMYAVETEVTAKP